MARSVICISHEAGAGGRELAADVAEALGFRYVDEEVMTHAAATEGVTVDELVDVERRKGFLSRLLIDFGRTGGASMYAMGVPTELVSGFAGPDQLRSAIRSAINDIAASGNVVIVSHAASHALDGDDVLRVLVVAPDDIRTGRLAAGSTDDGTSVSISEHDAGRRDYLKRFYDISDESAHHYDLVVNTGRVEPTAFTPVIVAAAQL